MMRSVSSSLISLTVTSINDLPWRDTRRRHVPAFGDGKQVSTQSETVLSCHSRQFFKGHAAMPNKIVLLLAILLSLGAATPAAAKNMSFSDIYDVLHRSRFVDLTQTFGAATP